MGKFLNLYYESIMTPTPTPYAPTEPFSEYSQAMIVVFDEDKMPLLSSRGVITSSFSSQGQLDNFASNLYGLIKGAKEVYSVIPELYTQAVTKLDDEEFYKYVKDNGILHKRLEDAKPEEQVFADALDIDPDFVIEDNSGLEKINESVESDTYSDRYTFRRNDREYRFVSYSDKNHIISTIEEIHPYDLADYHWSRSSTANPDVVEIRLGNKLVKLVDAFDDESEEPISNEEVADILYSYNKNVDSKIDRT